MKEKKESVTMNKNSNVIQGNPAIAEMEERTSLSLNQNRLLKHALEESELRYDQLIRNMPAAIYTCDHQGKITLFNDAAVKLWGRTPEIGKDFWCGSWKIYRPDGSDLPLDECPMAITLKEGKPVHGQEIVIERPDGEKRFVIPHPRPVFDLSGKLIGAFNMLIDITEIREAKITLQENEELSRKSEELKRSEERYHRMISEVEDYVIILLDREGNIQNWNKGAEKIKGYSPEEAVGKNLKIFYTPEDQKTLLPESLIQLAVEKGKATHEGWRVRKGGTRFWGSVVITALHNDDGDVIGFSKVTRDLTERKNAEEALKKNALQLEQKNKTLEIMNQELASFAYVSSHDLQEPLRKIQTFASRIVEMEEDKLSPKGKDYFVRMQNSAQRMQTLIEDLLTYSRTNTSEQKFEIIDLNRVLEDVKNELKETFEDKNATIEADVLPTVNAVPFQMNQLFTNIISNALKFSKADVPPKLQITVTKVSGESLATSLLTNLAENYYQISFTDNGIGFDQEYRHKIFEVFQRLHGRSEYSGTGIGLAICKKIVENHGGFMQADSIPDEGTTFYVYLPET